MDEREAEKQQFAAQEQELRSEIARAGMALEQLESELGAVDKRLSSLEKDGPKYEALARVCSSLDELASAGAAALFWGDISTRSETISQAREKLEAFQSTLASTQEQRRAFAEKVGKHKLVLEHLDYSLEDALEEEERRQAEWLVERTQSMDAFNRSAVMPWSRGNEEDRRLKNSVVTTAVLTLLLGMAIPYIDLPLPERAKLIEIPDRVARLVEMKRPKPVAVAELVQPAPIEPEPEPVVAEEVVPELSETPAPTMAETQPEPAKPQVRSKGILAFRDTFANRASRRTSAELGSQANFNNAGSNAIGRPSRAMVASNAAGSSGGINIGDISRDVGGGGTGNGIGGVAVTQVSSSIGGNGTSNRPMSGGPSAGRTDEEIQIVFDRYKSALYRLYNRELRKDPTLRGQVVLKLTIEPDGSVSFCQLQSSDMAAPALAEQIVTRVRGFDFGAKEDILPMTIVYPIDFLPAA